MAYSDATESKTLTPVYFTGNYPMSKGFGFEKRHATAKPPAPATPAAPIPTSFDQLPDCALLRESQLVPSPKRPGAMALLPFSAPTLWRKVKAGDFPKPLKLGPRITAWRCGDVRQWLAQQGAA